MYSSHRARGAGGRVGGWGPSGAGKMPVPGVPPLRPSSASSALRAKVLAQRRESPRFGQKSSFVPASRREPLEVQQLRGAILARFPSHAAAWFRLFDPEACGAVARPAFTAACRRLDLEVEVAGAAFDALARAGGTSARLTLGCLDPEAVMKSFDTQTSSWMYKETI